MNLKDARKVVGWTQVKLAMESRVPQQHISRLERGEVGAVSLNISRRVLKALHKAGLRGVTMDDLFPESKERVS